MAALDDPRKKQSQNARSKSSRTPVVNNVNNVRDHPRAPKKTELKRQTDFALNLREKGVCCLVTIIDAELHGESDKRFALREGGYSGLLACCQIKRWLYAYVKVDSMVLYMCTFSPPFMKLRAATSMRCS